MGVRESSREEESCNAISGGSLTFKIPRDQISPYIQIISRRDVRRTKGSRRRPLTMRG